MATATPSNLATFAAGCFWGVEHYFKKQFKGALIGSKVGYTGGTSATTDYRSVCSGKTGHAEAVQLNYDTAKTNYADLVTYFFRIHDPTTLNRQGNDAGTQYRSAIFYHTEEQKRIAEEVKEQVKVHFKKPIVTEIVPASTFIVAEDYHQNYLEQNPGGYCNHKHQW